MRADPQAYADVLVLAIKSALAPVVAAQTALQEQIADLSRRVQDDAFTKELGALRERVAVVEVRPVLPGPPGDPGPPGKDGADGKAGLTYLGVFQEGKQYEVGELVTWGGSMWHCNEATELKPGEGSKAWTLAVKRGRDGKDK
jgi:hypothetical protein